MALFPVEEEPDASVCKDSLGGHSLSAEAIYQACQQGYTIPVYLELPLTHLSHPSLKVLPLQLLIADTYTLTGKLEYTAENGKPAARLNGSDDTATARMEVIARQIIKFQGISEALSTQDQISPHIKRDFAHILLRNLF